MDRHTRQKIAGELVRLAKLVEGSGKFNVEVDAIGNKELWVVLSVKFGGTANFSELESARKLLEKKKWLLNKRLSESYRLPYEFGEFEVSSWGGGRIEASIVAKIKPHSEEQMLDLTEFAENLR
jgi:hypothetical protein